MNIMKISIAEGTPADEITAELEAAIHAVEMNGAHVHFILGDREVMIVPFEEPAPIEET